MLASTVRWFASLVVLCLLVGSAGNVRPRVDLRRDVSGDVRMTRADGALPHVTARRATPRVPLSPGHEVVPLAVLPLAPSVRSPPRELVERALAPATPFASNVSRAPSARGPPWLRSMLPSIDSV